MSGLCFIAMFSSVICWTCLASLVAARNPEDTLWEDDECAAPGVGVEPSCGLNALQRRGLKKSTEHADRMSASGVAALCAKADEACTLMQGQFNDHPTNVVSLKAVEYLLATAPATFELFQKAAHLSDYFVNGETKTIPCKKLCEAAANLLTSRGVMMPPKPDMGCYLTANGQTKCDVDLSPGNLVEVYGSPDVKSPAAADDNVTKRTFAPWQSLVQKKSGANKLAHKSSKQPTVNPFQRDFEQQVHYYEDELALRILYLFHVYPRAYNTFLADAITPDWQEQAAVKNLVARVMLVNAIRYIRLNDTNVFLDRWFGPDAHSSPAVVSEVLFYLNSVLTVMDTSELVFNSTQCSAKTFAFVYPNGVKGIPDPKFDGDSNIRMNPDGKLIVNLCPLALSTDPDIQFEGVQAYVHEASHHVPTSTQDVKVCHQYGYLTLDVDKLSTLDGSDCHEYTGKDAGSRFFIGAMNCDITGPSLLSITDQDASSNLAAHIDPDTKYYAEMLKFSQDGKKVVAEVTDMTTVLLNDTDSEDIGCYLCYGESTCKEVAKADPFKALNNADSFGYYVIDVGSAGLKMLAAMENKAKST